MKIIGIIVRFVLATIATAMIIVLIYDIVTGGPFVNQVSETMTAFGRFIEEHAGRVLGS